MTNRACRRKSNFLFIYGPSVHGREIQSITCLLQLVHIVIAFVIVTAVGRRVHSIVVHWCSLRTFSRSLILSCPFVIAFVVCQLTIITNGINTIMISVPCVSTPVHRTYCMVNKCVFLKSSCNCARTTCLSKLQINRGKNCSC